MGMRGHVWPMRLIMAIDFDSRYKSNINNTDL